MHMRLTYPFFFTLLCWHLGSPSICHNDNHHAANDIFCMMTIRLKWYYCVHISVWSFLLYFIIHIVLWNCKSTYPRALSCCASTLFNNLLWRAVTKCGIANLTQGFHLSVWIWGVHILKAVQYEKDTQTLYGLCIFGLWQYLFLMCLL